MSDPLIPLGEGYIKAFVFSGSGAYPVEGASVSVRRRVSGETLGMMFSGRDGETEPVAVAAPNEEFSETPGGITPYSTWEIVVKVSGYYTNIYEGVQVFSGIISLVNANMVPLPESAAGVVTEKVYIIGPHNLASQGGAV